MIIREANRDDVADIVRMLADDMLGKQREAYAEPLPDLYFEAFEQIKADPNHELVVADYDGIVIGCLQLSFLQYLTYQGGVRAQIEAVRVHEAHRGKGIGEQMIVWAIERARDRGAHLVQLTSDKQRDSALRFYEKLGFVASHEGFKLKF